MTSTKTVSSTWQRCCPKCGKDDEIDICAHVWVRLCPEGTDVSAARNGDHEWNDHNGAICQNCGHDGNVSDFTINGGSAQ